MNIWDAKNSTEQERNSSYNNVVEQNAITSEIESDSTLTACEGTSSAPQLDVFSKYPIVYVGASPINQRQAVHVIGAARPMGQCSTISRTTVSGSVI